MKSEIARRAGKLASRGPRVPKVVRVDALRVPTSPVESFHQRLEVADGEHLSIAIESIASDAVEGAALIEIRMLSASGARVSIPGWGQRSNRVAEYIYLEPSTAESIALTRIEVKVPKHAVRLELIGHRWKSSVATALVGDPVVNRSTDSSWVFTTPTGASLTHSARALDRVLQLPASDTRVEIRIEHVAERDASSGPVSITLLDRNGAEMLPLPTLQQHPHHGPIALLKGEPGKHVTTLVAFDVPFGAAAVRVRGVDWGAKTASVTGDITMLGTQRAESTIEEFIASIPHDDKLIVIDTTAPPMGHATLGLRPNNLSFAYARAGCWVVFLPFSSLQEFGNEVGTRLFQVARNDVDRLWSAIRAHRRGRADTYICSSFPSLAALSSAHEAKRLGWTVTYEVRDDMEEFNRVGYSKWYSTILEQQMLRTADRVVSVSRALDEKMESMLPGLRTHTVIPNGVRTETIEGGAALRTREAADRRASSSTVGYVGHLTPSWFDWPLLVRVAAAMPDVRFEIVGHGMPETLELPENVVYLGAKTHEELVDIVQHWQVGLIPFRDIPLTRSVDPNKIYEYFAWGLRCVTVEMGAVRDYPWTRVYDDAGSFVEHLRWALETPVTDEDLAELSQFMRTVDWNSRAQEMLAYMETGVRA